MIGFLPIAHCPARSAILPHWCQLKVKARLSKGVGCRVSGVGMELSVGA
ncbi:hypothetical protein [Coleofasciculus sp. E2-BRE-01]